MTRRSSFNFLAFRSFCCAASMVFFLGMVVPAISQTASTGAVRVLATDPSGAIVRGAHVTLTLRSTGEVRRVDTGSDGSAVVSLLPAGLARVEISFPGFDTLDVDNIQINVTESRLVAAHLSVGKTSTRIDVTAENNALQTEGNALGDVVSQEKVVNLPLSSRNFTQIIGLSAGEVADVNNAASVGLGSGSAPDISDSGGNTFSHGDRGYDNDFQMNGLQVNDIFAQGTTSGGVPVPNPDTVEEFKVQTAQYDASFGRHAGANVDLITRGGTNRFHGTVFEFFRNTDLNANDYFAKQNGQPRAELDQNQFGGTFGGPIQKNRLFFFGSYQGTRQVDAVANVATVFAPPFTNDRSAAALGSLFAGQRGYFQDAFGGVGPSINADGSNINPAALALLQAKLSNGSYLIPTPQTINTALPFAEQGASTFSPPTIFNENQYMGNGDYQINTKQRLSVRFFTAGDYELLPVVAGNTPAGYSSLQNSRFIDSSIQHSWILSSNLLNEFRVGFNRTVVAVVQNSPDSFSDLGIAAPAQINHTPVFDVLGSYGIGGSNEGTRAQNALLADETLAWTHGKHTIRVGGGFGHFQRNLDKSAYFGELQFQSFPDLLLGLDAAQDGTANIAPLGNIYAAVAITGDFNRNNRVWQAYGYGQDEYRLATRFTLNLGIRYDWLPPLTDASGRMTNLNSNLMNPNPDASGSLDGVTVASNFQGAIPAGVIKEGGSYVISGNDDGVFGPRVGFSWQMFPNSDAIVVRGGYGVYYSTLTGEVMTQGDVSQPFGTGTILGGPAEGAGTLQNPYPSSIPTSYPTFTPYSPTTALSPTIVADNIRPGIVQQASLGTQTLLPHGFVLELGTVGVRSTHLLRTNGINQSSLASPANPIRGVTTNTVDNIAERAPFLGFAEGGLNQVQSEGSGWYNDLEATLRKQLRRGMNLQASYTFSKTLDSDGVDVTSTASGGTAPGNQLSNHARYGPANFSRPQRLVVSYVYDLPFFQETHGLEAIALKGWGVAGVTTIQSGHTLTVLGTNSNNVYGITNDIAELAPNCSTSMEGVGGTVQSKIGGSKAIFFNSSCFLSGGSPLPYPVIGDDGVGTDFGNSGIGPVRGPAQNNYDISIIKRIKVPINDVSMLEFRSEFFNAFNTPQFSDPDTLTSDSTFGNITSLSVAPRIIQFALKANF